MTKSVMDVYDEVVAWCDGGPTPNREDVLGALQWMIQERTTPIPPAIPPPAPEGLDPEVLAPNVVVYDPRFKDPDFARIFLEEQDAAAIRAARPAGPNPVILAGQ